MNIAFLSSLNPANCNNWSGTLYYIYTSLQKEHELTWIGGTLLSEIKDFHRGNFGSDVPFVPERYALLFGKLLSDKLKNEYYDIVVCRDYFFAAYLVVDIPIIYIGDTTFQLFNQYLDCQDKEFIRLADQLEQSAILKANKIVYSSDWAKESAVRDYHVNVSKIEVIEFGANLDVLPHYDKEFPRYFPCNLLFIGKNWKMKGGDKALEVYHLLKDRGFDCTLTIVGSNPPISLTEYPEIEVYPFIDKSTAEGRELFDKIWSRSHFLLLPTLFDCFGIVFCEASAYGVPSLGALTGGVSQVVRENENGFLFPVDAAPSEYADKIQKIFTEGEVYAKLRDTTRKQYEERLNWETWLAQMNRVLEQIMNADKPDYYIPVYAINLKERTDRREHLLKEFQNKEEFELTIVDASVHSIGAVGLWNSIVRAVEMAKEKGDDIIIICEDDHFFTKNYSSKLLFREIVEANVQGADVLLGGICGFGHAARAGVCRYRVDWFWSTQFVVVYSHFFDKIVSYQFADTDTADGVLSELAANKMVIFPFISEQKEFGYSDVTMHNNRVGAVDTFFEQAKRRLSLINTLAR